MALSIELTADEQDRVELAARRRGMGAAEFAKNLLMTEWPIAVSTSDHREIDRNHFYFTASREEFKDALSRIGQMNKDLPILGDDAFDRESFYEDRF